MGKDQGMYASTRIRRDQARVEKPHRRATPKQIINQTVVSDSGYTGIKKLQQNSRLPRKSSKKKPLTKEEKRQNREISSERVVNENVIGSLKRFKIVSDRYRNRRKRFGLRFNLIAGVHNFELAI